ncbi:MAG: alpha-glucan family phosphorylase, partial [Candidatus Dormibacteraceae bacterium]
MYEELERLAFDLTWSWEPRIQALFQALAPALWDESAHNPAAVLARLGPAAVEERLEEECVRDALADALAAHAERRDRPRPGLEAGAPLLVGYFSLEFGLAECLPIYSGGLGILAGDHLKAAGDLGLPLVGVGLFYRQGFARQRINEGGDQEEIYPEIRPQDLPITRVETDGAPLEVEAPIGAGSVRIAVWRLNVGRVPLYLLDTDLESNPADLRGITDRLYVSDPGRRLRQEIVLGIGGLRALKRLGLDPTVFHLNEGHSFLAAIERIRELARSRQLTLEEARLIARAGVVFTTHTPVEAGSDYFEPGLVADVLGPYLEDIGLPSDRFMDLGRKTPGDPESRLCTTYMALRMADHSVGVSRLHGTISRRLWKEAWPGVPEAQVPIGAITNGVHMPTWVAPDIDALLAGHVAPRWSDLDPEDPAWEGIASISDQELWGAHVALRGRLAEFAGRRGTEGDSLDPEALTIGFSRRFAPYKRATLLFRDPSRLARLLNVADSPVQIVFAGKSHPADAEGKAILHEVVAAARREPGIFFLEDYDIEVARNLVRGADVWLNNPRRFLEASGTSGMKAAANGVLNLSILDGWWDEGYRPGLGWAIPSGATLDRPQTDDAAEAET